MSKKQCCIMRSDGSMIQIITVQCCHLLPVHGLEIDRFQGILSRACSYFMAVQVESKTGGHGSQTTNTMLQLLLYLTNKNRIELRLVACSRLQSAALPPPPPPPPPCSKNSAPAIFPFLHDSIGGRTIFINYGMPGVFSKPRLLVKVAVPQKNFSAGSFYKIDHAKLPQHAHNKLNDVRVVKVIEMTELDVTVSYPSKYSLWKNFSSMASATPSAAADPKLDKMFVMSLNDAGRVLRLTN